MLALQYHLDPHGDFISATPVEARVLHVIPAQGSKKIPKSNYGK